MADIINIRIDELFGGEIEIKELDADELEQYSQSYADFISNKSSDDSMNKNKE